jgi:hypothetical protein
MNFECGSDTIILPKGVEGTLFFYQKEITNKHVLYTEIIEEKW